MLYELFKRCLEIPYLQTGKTANYAVEREGEQLYIFFEKSDGDIDWLYNLNFPPKPNGIYYAHGGFLNAWKEIQPEFDFYIMNPHIKKITAVGYSHGGALALLCHQYLFEKRRDIQKGTYSFGFGCPRVIWGDNKSIYSDIWKNFYTIGNLDDLVTHLPPKAIGYFNVGNMHEIGKNGKYSPVNAHRSENYLKELKGL